MIPRGCKRLAEADFPIAVVSKHAAREKSIRYGHPSTLHLWWARRPLASSRAVLLALLLPDPADPNCPQAFIEGARAALNPLAGMSGARNGGPEDLREALLRFIGDFANWDLAGNPTYMAAARALVRAAHGDDRPLVVDPFAGGGSIPLEALRLGCETYASDLNPVAGLILKTMLEDVPRHGPGLAEKVRTAGAAIKAAAEQELVRFYPTDPDGARPIAYLWARTVRCEAPDCGVEIPIYRSPWLSRRGSTKARYFREDANGDCAALIVDHAPRGGPISFRVAIGFGSERPRSGYTELKGTKVPGNTAAVRCLCCGSILPGNKSNPRVQMQLRVQRGGSDVEFDENGQRKSGATLLAVVTLRRGEAQRSYRMPTDADYAVVRAAQEELSRRVAAHQGPTSLIPDEPLPPEGTLGFRVQRYGMTRWGDLFTARQKLALATVARIAQEARGQADDVTHFIGLTISRWTDIFNALCRWENTKTQVRNLFGRQAIPIIWDFAETSIFGGQAGDFSVTLETMLRVVGRTDPNGASGQVGLGDARNSPLPDETATVWFTDPPYYDAVPYSDLSDFFFVWLKRSLPGHSLLCDPSDRTNPLTPKTDEIVQDETKVVGNRPKDREFFEDAVGAAFAEGRRVTHEDGIGGVVFAHKTTEGWEALLSGLTRGGWTITASWPIATEAATRLRAKDSAALATSIHLVCRPRDSAAIGDWGEVLAELPRRVGDWMERLEREGVRGADLVFACIGPALEVFSRYAQVETAEGLPVPLGEYLEKVWEVVGRTALEQVLGTAEARARNSAAGALEEDARLTALFLWTLASEFRGARAAEMLGRDDEEDEVGEMDELEDDDDNNSGGSKPKGYTLVYDIVRRFAQPLGIHLDSWKDRIVAIDKGVVRLLPVTERARQLFGEAGAEAIASAIERDPTRAAQMDLFPEADAAPVIRGRRRATVVSPYTGQVTMLDRVHAAMLLQRSGQTNALRALLKAEVDRGPDFGRLANALSALYPRDAEEKRLLDAMLLAMPGR